MIKDIVVNLPLRADKDRTTAFAASLAGYFGAHVTGIAFMYWPLFACVQMGAAEARCGKHGEHKNDADNDDGAVSVGMAKHPILTCPCFRVILSLGISSITDVYVG